jgi:hypothetical protein
MLHVTLVQAVVLKNVPDGSDVDVPTAGIACFAGSCFILGSYIRANIGFFLVVWTRLIG